MQIIMFIVVVLSSTLLGKKIQDVYGIPLPLSLIAISVIASMFIHVNIDFSILMMVLLPLLLISDSLHIKFKDIKQNFGTILYSAFFAVIISVVAGVYIMSTLMPSYDIVFYVLLFSIIMATDAISVTTVFAKFPALPNKTKFLAEAESLFNDATAVIIFTLVALPMAMGVNVSPISVFEGTLKVFVVSIAIGVAFGTVFSYIMSYFHETIDEFLIIPLIAYSSYMVAELFHVSGILAVIASIMMFKDYITRNMRTFVDATEKSRKYITRRLVTTKAKLQENENLITYISFIAIAFLFASLGAVISVEALVGAWKEILIVFGVVTGIRFTAFLPVMINKDLNIKDVTIFTFGGIKGGLAVLMVHMVPATYALKESLQVIVFGQIVLSTFVYVGFLLLLIPRFYKAS